MLYEIIWSLIAQWISKWQKKNIFLMFKVMLSVKFGHLVTPVLNVSYNVELKKKTASCTASRWG